MKLPKYPPFSLSLSLSLPGCSLSCDDHRQPPTANDQRSQAEAFFNLCRNHHPDNLALRLAHHLHSSLHHEIRAMSAILLRKQLTRNDTAASTAAAAGPGPMYLWSCLAASTKAISKKLCDTVYLLICSASLVVDLVYCSNLGSQATHLWILDCGSLLLNLFLCCVGLSTRRIEEEEGGSCLWVPLLDDEAKRSGHGSLPSFSNTSFLSIHTFSWAGPLIAAGHRKTSGHREVGMETVFYCPFCNHPGAVECLIDLKHSVGVATCRACGESYTTKAHALSEPIDIYSESINECERVNTT